MHSSTCGNPPDVQSSTRVEETVDNGVVVCARSYTDGTFTGSSTPCRASASRVLSASTIGRVFHSSASRYPGASASVRAHRVSVCRDRVATSVDKYTAPGSAVISAPAPMEEYTSRQRQPCSERQRQWTGTSCQRQRLRTCTSRQCQP